MKTNAITLKEAYIIENLRKQEITNEELIQINDQTIEDWKDVIDSEDFDILKKLAEENKDYISVIQDGYQVKFLTLNGLINLVQLKFNKKKDVDFTVHEDGISNLRLAEQDNPKMRQFLSQNWKVIEDGEKIEVRSVNS